MDENKQFGEQAVETANEAAEAVTAAAEETAEAVEETVEAAEETAEAVEETVEAVEETTEAVEDAAEEAAEELSPEAAFVEEMMADRRPAEDLPIEELPLSEKPVRAPKDPAKKERTAKIIVLSVMGAVLTGLLVLAIVHAVLQSVKKAAEAAAEAGQTGQTVEQNDGQTGQTEIDDYSQVDMDQLLNSESYSYTDKSLSAEYNSKIAVKVGNHEMTNGLLQIFYWAIVINDLTENSEYVAYRGPDTSRPFSEQKYGEDVTWEQHYLQSALDYYQQNIAFYEKAEQEGTIDEEATQKYLDQIRENLEAQAAERGMDSVEALLEQNYGPNVTVDDYLEFTRLYYISLNQAAKMQLDVTVTDEEINDFYDAHAEDYAAEGVEKTDETGVSVRHILISPEQDVDSDGDGTPDDSSEDAWESAEGRANTVYEEWKEDPTEDHFAELAGTYTDDPGSKQNGGLYENFLQGQMVSEFDDWCFDPAREIGDTGIVRTQFGYHIMYFTDREERPHWQSVAEQDCSYDKFNKIIGEIFEQYEIDVNYENVHLYDVIAVSMQQTEAAGE